MSFIPGQQPDPGSGANGVSFTPTQPPQAAPVNQTDVGALQAQITALLTEKQSLAAQLQDLQGRYNGQQGAIQREVEAKKQAVLKVDQLQTDLAAKEAEWNNKFVTTDTQVKTLEQQLNERTAKLQGFEKREVTRTTIAKDFKELVPLYDEGLMPGVESLEPEAMTTFLTKFKTVADQLRTGAVVNQMVGSTPNAGQAPASGASLTIEQLTEQMMTMSPFDPKYGDFKAQRATLLEAKMKT